MTRLWFETFFNHQWFRAKTNKYEKCVELPTHKWAKLRSDRELKGQPSIERFEPQQQTRSSRHNQQTNITQKYANHFGHSRMTTTRGKNDWNNCLHHQKNEHKEAKTSFRIYREILSEFPSTNGWRLNEIRIQSCLKRVPKPIWKISHVDSYRKSFKRRRLLWVMSVINVAQ